MELRGGPTRRRPARLYKRYLNQQVNECNLLRPRLACNWHIVCSLPARNAQMLPFVLIGGLLLVRRIRRFDLVISFGLATLAITPLASLIDNTSVLSALQGAVLYSPFAFFGFVMLHKQQCLHAPQS